MRDYISHYPSFSFALSSTGTSFIIIIFCLSSSRYSIQVVNVFIILGFAALIRWNLDLAAIAGIIAAVGTGVDDQIVITDEVMYGRKNQEHWLKRMKNAFFIIFAAYFTMLVAMLPLYFLGAGVLRGFALTTIVGVTIGVFITRPAYGKMIEILMEKDE